MWLGFCSFLFCWSTDLDASTSPFNSLARQWATLALSFSGSGSLTLTKVKAEIFIFRAVTTHLPGLLCHTTAILIVVTSHISNPFHYTTSTKMAPKRPPPTHKSTPSAVQMRQKAKKVVSTSTLFAQIPKLKAAHTSTRVSALERVTALKQPQARRMVAVVIPKKGTDHPLLNEFNGLSLTFSPALSNLSAWRNQC